MELKYHLAERGFQLDKVPVGYQILGDVLLLKFPIGVEIGLNEKSDMAKALADILNSVRVVAEIKRVDGELRTPKVTVLFSKGGKSLETVHIENGIEFKLDARKIMFSKGNVSERARLVSKIKPGETIIDMFAGIGYFSLGIAKNSAAAKIIAIEKNIVAFKYLKENVKLNGIKNITPIKSDCRRAKISDKADRVLMGYFPDTQKFLPYAFRFLKDRGVIHYHNVYREDEMVERPVTELKDAAKKAGYKVVGVAQHIVKSYAPRTFHVVVDAEVEKADSVSAKTPQEFYNRTADIYDMRQQNKWTARLREAEIALLKKHAIGRVLDVGCGTGYHLAALFAAAKSAGGKTIEAKLSDPGFDLTGIDVSKAMLEAARKVAPNARFVEGRAELLPFENESFDTVLCMFSTLNLCDYAKALAEMYRVLKRGGKLILSVSSVHDNDGKSEKRIRIEGSVIKLHLFIAAELTNAFSQTGFEVIEFSSLFRTKRPRWGDWQSDVEDELTLPVERGAIYLCVLGKK